MQMCNTDTILEMEVLKKKLADMEKENLSLRKELGRKPRVDIFPESIYLKHPVLENVLYRRFSYGYNTVSSFDRILSNLIRSTVFYETKKIPSNKFIACQAMDEQQYAIYLETADAILSALSTGRSKALEIEIGKVENNE